MSDSEDFYKLRQARFFEGQRKIRIMTANIKQYAIAKRCDLHDLKKIKKTGMSEIAIQKGSTYKLYGGKYYRQRLVFRSPGEPHMLDNFRSEFFVEVFEFRYNPLRTLQFLEHEATLGECGEWIKMERLHFHACDAKPMKAHALHDALIGWLNRLREYLPKSGIFHRDICLSHIMYSMTRKAFKLIDFAVAIPRNWKLEPTESLERFDDMKQIEVAIQQVQQMKEEAYA